MSENTVGKFSIHTLNEMAGWGKRGVFDNLLNPSAFKGTDKLIRAGCLKVFNTTITSGLMDGVRDAEAKRLLLSTLPTPQESRDVWLLDSIDKSDAIHLLPTAARTAYLLKRLLVNPSAKISTIHRRFDKLTDELICWHGAFRKLEGLYPSVDDYLEKFRPIATIIKENIYSLLDDERVGNFATESIDKLMSTKFETSVVV